MQVKSSATPLLTVDEANEDTISAFEETDAAEDLRIRNSVCLVIDLEGFSLQKKFQVREMGYYSWNEHFGRHAFFQPVALKALSHKDKKTVNFAKHNIHGLTYQPRYQERAYEHNEVDIVLLRLYNQFKTEERTVVAYKGGHVEKDLLNKLNIPCLDLETWGCPKYEQLKQTIVEPLASCGFHLNDNIHHCPMAECHAFWLWFQTYVMQYM